MPTTPALVSVRPSARRILIIGAVLVFAALPGCTTSARVPTRSSTVAHPSTSTLAALAGRPFTVHVPPGYRSTVAAPLLVMLHGYSSNGPLEEAYLDLTPTAGAHGMLYVYPTGTVDNGGITFWNATDACCNRFGSSVDDSGYLSAMITEIEREYNVDRRRVFIVGHSNGGFMAYRMACDHADQIAAIVSLEAATWADPSRCQPSQPVAILEVHGTADTSILYGGGGIVNNANHVVTYPSAAATVAAWVAYDRCGPTPDRPSRPPRPIEQALPPATVTAYSRCAPGGHVELWTQAGGDHVPEWSATFDEQIVDFLLAHPKP